MRGEREAASQDAVAEDLRGECRIDLIRTVVEQRDCGSEGGVRRGMV
jgi:hypothetical protein